MGGKSTYIRQVRELTLEIRYDTSLDRSALLH